MAFPANIFTAYTLVDNVNDVLATHPNALSVDLRAVEIKIGIDGSAVAASWDYFLKHASGAYRGHRHDGGADDGAASIGPITGLTLANNVDMGNYQVRAKQFYADVASGTAPLVITSDSHVVNLNVDRVDNLHLPATIADILTDHDKPAHDALGIDASTLDGQAGSYYVTSLGSWVTKSDNTTYLAATDGFVQVTFVTTAGDAHWRSIGYTDGNNPPTTMRGGYEGDEPYVGDVGSFCMPVKKGDRYKVHLVSSDGKETQTIYWIPMGA